MGLPRIAITYQRPLGDTFHGGVNHIRGFLEGLSGSFDLEVVAPPLFYDPHKESRRGLRLAMESTLRATLQGLRFVLREARTPKDRRARLILSFDVYAASVPFLWARIARLPYVYYAQDYTPELVASGRKVRQRGAGVLRLLRSPVEYLLFRKSSEILVVTEDIKTHLVRAGIPEGKIRVIGFAHRSPVANPEAIQRWTTDLGLDSRTGVVFLGNMGYAPNRRAAEYVAHTLAPAVGRTYPDARFLLVGAGSIRFNGKTPANVLPLGPVDDLDNLLFACHIGIAPLDFGSGISGKVRDYLLHGLIAVLTPAASKGIPSSSCDAIICPIEQFPEALLKVLQDGNHPPGHLREVPPEIQRAYSGDSSMRSVCDDLRVLLAGPPRPPASSPTGAMTSARRAEKEPGSLGEQGN